MYQKVHAQSCTEQLAGLNGLFQVEQMDSG